MTDASRDSDKDDDAQTSLNRSFNFINRTRSQKGALGVVKLRQNPATVFGHFLQSQQSKRKSITSFAFEISQKVTGCFIISIKVGERDNSTQSSSRFW